VENRTFEHWYQDNQGKLLTWREWREQLATMSNDESADEVSKWWSNVPMVNKGVDPWRPETWPTPWDLVCQGQFCPSGQGLGMFYSLSLIGKECELILAIVNEEKKPRLMVLLPDNKLLNYYYSEVGNINEANVQVLQRWSAKDLPDLIKV
jgi:hypothetical protein